MCQRHVTFLMVWFAYLACFLTSIWCLVNTNRPLVKFTFRSASIFKCTNISKSSHQPMDIISFHSFLKKKISFHFISAVKMAHCVTMQQSSNAILTKITKLHLDSGLTIAWLEVKIISENISISVWFPQKLSYGFRRREI